MNLFDTCGAPLSGGTSAALERYEAAVGMMLGRPGDTKQAASAALAEDPGFVSAYCLRAALLVMSTDESAETPLRECLDAAGALLSRANDRERRHLSAARAWLARDFPESIRQYGDILVDYPRDRLALRVAHFGDLFLGQRSMLRDRVAQVLPFWNASDPDYGYVLGMYAFGLEENAHYAQAEDTARHALELEPANPGAIHAVAHVMEMQGRHREGIAWLNGNASQWNRGNATAIHLWWHLALFHLDLDEVQKALEIHDVHIRPGAALAPSALADAASLLWRLHLRDIPLGKRWSALARSWVERRLSGAYPFHDLHALVSFIGAGDSARTDAILHSLRARAEGDGPGARRVRDISLPIARALAAFGSGNYGVAIEELDRVRLIGHVGASHAQRDALHLTLTEAALRHHRLRLAHALAAERTALKAASGSNRALLRRATEGLRLAS